MDPLDLGTPDLTWRAVSPRMRWVVAASAAVVGLVTTVGALVIWLVTDWVAMAYLAGACGVGSLARGILAVRAVRAWGYAERTTDLAVRHGLLVRRLSLVPYARMQFVDVTAGPIQRLAGLATVRLHTAAASTDATVPGLEAAEAARLRDHLAELGQLDSEGL